MVWLDVFKVEVSESLFAVISFVLSVRLQAVCFFYSKDSLNYGANIAGKRMSDTHKNKKSGSSPALRNRDKFSRDVCSKIPREEYRQFEYLLRLAVFPQYF